MAWVGDVPGSGTVRTDFYGILAESKEKLVSYCTLNTPTDLCMYGRSTHNAILSLLLCINFEDKLKPGTAKTKKRKVRNGEAESATKPKKTL